MTRSSHLLLKPLHCFILGDTVLVTNSALSFLSVGDTVTRASQHDVEIHPIDANTRVILYAKINVLLDTKTKVALVREVLLSQLILLDL